MKNIVLLLFFIFTNVALSNEVRYTQEDAINISGKALVKHTKVKKTIKDMEQFIYRYSPIDEEYLVPVGTIATTLFTGKISTKMLKINGRVFRANVKPEFMYNIYNKEVKLAMGVSWDF